MTESTMRRNVIDALKNLRAVAVENVACPGFPDVSYEGGLLELKELPKWPKSEDAIVRIPTLTKQQRLFLVGRRDTYLLLRVGRDWLLFDGNTASNEAGDLTQKQMRLFAIRTWSSLREMRGELEDYLALPGVLWWKRWRSDGVALEKTED